MLDWSNPAKKYEEMALDSLQLRGIKNGNYPVITKKDHPQHWRDWYAYYVWRKLRGSQEIMRTKESKTVPTLSPFDFDAEFVLNKPAPEVPEHEPVPNRTPRFLIEREKAIARNADRVLLHEDVTFDQWRAMSRDRSVPVGAIWVACLGRVYGPKPAAVQRRDAAE